MVGKLLLVVGKSTMGKSHSLKYLRDADKVIYINSESGKRLPFKHGFKEFIITDPIPELLGEKGLLDKISKHPDKAKTVVIDSITFLMDMVETKYVKTAKDTRQAWGIYSDFFINLVNQEIPKLIKAGINVIVIAHAADMINEKTLSMEVVVPVKGSIRTKGVEAFFNDIVACKRLPITELENYESDLLHITDKERQKKLKYVIQTQVTADTVCERLRGPEDMWEEKETFIDSNVQTVLDRMDQFYGE